MLEHLFGSKTRVRLLRIFLNHQDIAYYVRELTRLADSQINAVRRELDNLEKIGLVTSFKQKATGDKRSQSVKKYYQVNVNYILYPELKALLLKAQILIENDLVSKIRKIGTIKYLALTGIFVGFVGAPTDMFLVGNVDKNKFDRLIKRFEKELNYEVNYTIMKPNEYKYRREIMDKFLYNILENKKIVVVDEL